MGYRHSYFLVAVSLFLGGEWAVWLLDLVVFEEFRILATTLRKVCKRLIEQILFKNNGFQIFAQ